MQHFSTLSHNTQNQYQSWARTQNDVHAGRLFCWSGALVTISIWGAMQFFDGQNRDWNRRHPHRRPTMATQEVSLPPTPEGLIIMQRVTEHRYQRAVLAKRSKAR